MGKRTPLFPLHQELGARIVDFGGWDMPVQYSSQIGEHHAVRRAAGVFDVSHMCIVDLRGARVRTFLGQLLANDVGKLTTPGKALYSCMLNEQGGVLDDLIVYYLTESWFRAVVNAGTRDKDLAWMRRHAAASGVEVSERTDLAMLAVQGPEARAKAAQLLAPGDAAAALALGSFSGRELSRLVRGAHRLHRRRRLRDHAAGSGGDSRLAAAQLPRRCLLRTRRARHAAARGRDESLRQRHGREQASVRIGPRVDA